MSSSRSKNSIPVLPDRMWKTSSPPVSPKKGRNVRDKLEESPNGRATCQRCGEKISKGEIRVGLQGKVNTPQGITVWRPRYYHDGCVTEETKRSLKLESAAEARKKARTGNKNSVAAAGTDRKKPATPLPAKSSRKSILKPSIRRQLERDLRGLRSCFAETQECEPYKIFQNKSLLDMLEKLPTNKTELMQCLGIKGRRCDQYGDSILYVINSHLQRNQNEQQKQQRGAGGRDGRSVSSTNNSRRQCNTNSSTAAAASASQHADSDDDDEVQIIGPVLSIEEIVRQRVRDAERRGEVFEIL